MSLLVNRACMEGVIVFDLADRYRVAVAEMGKWMREGSFKTREDIVDNGSLNCHAKKNAIEPMAFFVLLASDD